MSNLSSFGSRDGRSQAAGWSRWGSIAVCVCLWTGCVTTAPPAGPVAKPESYAQPPCEPLAIANRMLTSFVVKTGLSKRNTRLALKPPPPGVPQLFLSTHQHFHRKLTGEGYSIADTDATHVLALQLIDSDGDDEPQLRATLTRAGKQLWLYQQSTSCW